MPTPDEITVVLTEATVRTLHARHDALMARIARLEAALAVMSVMRGVCPSCRRPVGRGATMEMTHVHAPDCVVRAALEDTDAAPVSVSSLAGAYGDLTRPTADLLTEVRGGGDEEGTDAP